MAAPLKAIDCLEILATLMTIIGVWLISEVRLVEGYTINGLSDILWAIWGYFKSAYYLIALQLLLFLIMCNGLKNVLL
jgi:hypothetical protein